MARKKDSEEVSFLMEASTKDSGVKIRCMALENSITPMGLLLTKVLGFKESFMELERYTAWNHVI
jgi:hypothetical protein